MIDIQSRISPINGYKSIYIKDVPALWLLLLLLFSKLFKCDFSRLQLICAILV